MKNALLRKAGNSLRGRVLSESGDVGYESAMEILDNLSFLCYPGIGKKAPAFVKMVETKYTDGEEYDPSRILNGKSVTYINSKATNICIDMPFLRKDFRPDEGKYCEAELEVYEGKDKYKGYMELVSGGTISVGEMSLKKAPYNRLHVTFTLAKGG